MACSRLDELVEKIWSWRLQEHPEFATTIGDHRYDDRLQSRSPQSYEKRHKIYCRFLQELEKIDTKHLNKRDLLTYELQKKQLQCYVEGYQWRFHGAYNCINIFYHFEHEQRVSLLPAISFTTVKDFENYLSRLEKTDVKIDEQIALLRESIKQQTTNHASGIKDVIKTLKEKGNLDNIEGLACYQPFKAKLDTTTDRELLKVKDDLKTRAKHVMKTIVQPSLLKMSVFLEEEYLPKTRTTPGVCGLPQGVQFYQACLAWNIDCDMTPQEVHDIGLREVERIKANMEQIKDQVNFTGSLKDFMEHLRTDKQHYHETEEQLLEEYKQIIDEHITPKVPLLFRKVPDVKLEVKSESGIGSTGMYSAPANKGDPGIFLVNLRNPETRPRFYMTVLSLHEAIPGHHLQVSVASGEELPLFRWRLDFQNLHDTPMTSPWYCAYTEGWGLYCEYLGEEMGMYRNPYDLFGRYSEEIARACRLVVDTGLHAFGWSIEQATEYLLENTCWPVDIAKYEVKRYLIFPGQACSYKIGELKIKELRKHAEETLGEKFSIKDFHDVILKEGRMPLDTLTKVVQQWIDEKQCLE